MKIYKVEFLMEGSDSSSVASATAYIRSCLKKSGCSGGSTGVPKSLQVSEVTATTPQDLVLAVGKRDFSG